jgi:hypothetical protein
MPSQILEIVYCTIRFGIRMKLVFKGCAIILEKMLLKKLCETLKLEHDEDSSADFVESVLKMTHVF